jgi:hypothetical protein
MEKTTICRISLVAKALGNDVIEKAFQAHLGGVNARIGAGFGQGTFHYFARTKNIDGQQAHYQGENGSEVKVGQGLDADAPNYFEITQLGNAHHQCRKHQGTNDHFDQTQEYLTEQLQAFAPFLGQKVAQGNAQNHSDEDPPGDIYFSHNQVIQIAKRAYISAR